MENQYYFGEFIGRQPSKPKPNSFMNQISETIKKQEPNISVTENGAIGYRTSGTNLVDLNFKVSSLRNMSESKIYTEFMNAFYDDPMLAWKWLFFLRDIRGGLGERRSFRAILERISNIRPTEVKKLIPLVAEYGRYDDLWVLLDTELAQNVIDFINKQLIEDIESYKQNKSISLLAKWLPSRNASSKITKHYADIIITGLNIDRMTYQQILSKLRAYLKIVERDMSSNNWENIDYNTVPSKANLNYNAAFLKHDEQRRREFLDALSNGNSDVKINAGALFPYELAHQYGFSLCNRSTVKSYDETIEQLWKNLPDYVQGEHNVMVVADSSFSMTTYVGNTSVTAMEVAFSLAIYFAERNTGAYSNQCLTFSTTPKYISFQKAKSLKEKIEIMLRDKILSNTNIKAVFDTVLDTAVKNHLTQKELPETILILSDMEFDSATYMSYGSRWKSADKTLFDTIQNKYKKHGYKLPKLVFWNIVGRTNTIPVTQNDSGVILVSGFSPSICKMVLSNKTDPYEVLLEQLNTKRYQPIEDALQ